MENKRNDGDTLLAVSYAWMAIAYIVAFVVTVSMTGCVSTTEKTTTVKYDSAGVMVEQTTTEKREGWPLRRKGVSTHTWGFLGELTTAVDPETGMIMPTVKMADMDNRMDTLPMMGFSEDCKVEGGANYSEYLNAEKSLWGAELSHFTYERKSAGANAPAPSVKLDVKANLNGTTEETKEAK